METLLLNWLNRVSLDKECLSETIKLLPIQNPRRTPTWQTGVFKPITKSSHVEKNGAHSQDFLSRANYAITVWNTRVNNVSGKHGRQEDRSQTSTQSLKTFVRKTCSCGSQSALEGRLDCT